MTGSAGTIGGYWHYDASTKTVAFDPTSGKDWLSADYIGGQCYLNASQLFPKG